MDLSEKLSKKTDIPSHDILGVLIRMIYELVEFHVRRLFELDSFDRASLAYDSRYLLEDPRNWFYMLFNAIMPGAVFVSMFREEGIRVDGMIARVFQPIKKDDGIFKCSILEEGGDWNGDMRIWSEEVPFVPIYVSSTPSPRQESAQRPPLVIGIVIEKEYPCCPEILEYLVKDVTVAFGVTRGDLKVIVTPTKDIPSAEKGRRELLELFMIPIHVPIMVTKRDPFDSSGEMFIPKASCYHPTAIFTNSPELYGGHLHG